MLTTPSLEEIVEGPRGMLCGIDAALDAQCMVSAVTLCFSTIDAVAALSRPKEQVDTSRHVFIEWVNRFMLPADSVPCSAIDLYGARCGVLHTYSPDSSLRASGQARPLFYEWQAGPAAASERTLPDGAVVVNVESLVDAVRASVRRFVATERSDPELSASVDHHLKDLLCYVPW